MYLTIILIGIAFFIFCIKWMVQMLSLTKQSRIIHSMTLKTLLVYCQSKGVEVDIQKIQKEIEAKL